MTKATRKLLEQHFDIAFTAPDGMTKLRGLILTLAMQGKLVEQDPNDPPAADLLKEIKAEKQRLLKEGKIKKPKALPPIKLEDVPYELPQGWEWVRLGDVACLITKGATPTTYGFAFETSGIPFVKVENVKNGSIQFTDKMQFISEEAHKYQKRSQLEEYDLLFSIAGTIGETCVVKAGDLPANINQALAIIRGYTGIFSSQFLINALDSAVSNEIKNRARGAAMNNISLGDIKDMIIPAPPLPEQHRIVARIDQLMARCDALETLRKQQEKKRLTVHAAAIKQLLDTPDGSAWDFIKQHFGELYTVKENVAELRKAILQLGVMGRLVPQNPNDPPASELLKEIEAEKQRLVKAGKIKKNKALPPIKPEEMPYELPLGWEWCRMQDIFFSLKYGTSKKCRYDGGAAPVLRIPNISNGRISIDDLKYTDLSEKEKTDFSLEEDDLLIIRSNGSASLVGRAAVVGKEASGFCYAGYLMRIRSNRKFLNSYYLYQVFDCEMTRGAIEGPVRTTSGVKNVNSSEISQLKVPLPPLPEQHRIVARIDQLMALCDTLEQQIEAATGKQTELLNAVMAQV